MEAKLYLSNGSLFKGTLIGAKPSENVGELVFTTSMVGYSESITDPSFCDQILVFSYPIIGNYGLPCITEKEFDIFHFKKGHESSKAWVSGVVIGQDTSIRGNEAFGETLDNWLRAYNITGIAGIDTRELIKLIRETGNLTGKISLDDLNQNDLSFDLMNSNPVAKVSIKKRINIGSGNLKVVLVDFGVKWGIIRELLKNNCRVEIVPWDDNFLNIDCDGYVLSNGPGDPASLEIVFPIIRELIRRGKKILGICLGHQLLALATGAKTIKLPHGHRGYNHPVIRQSDNMAFMTSQNHSYVICEESLNKSVWDISFVNANDLTIEGISHKEGDIKGVQFHPEASGGPNDCLWILQDFIKSLK
jgi:carbamoyl-phosphate synthase small subunit